MDWPAGMLRGVLTRRYKRFLADVVVAGKSLTVHCPNTGAMAGCSEPGSTVWLSVSDNPKRKYAYTLEVVETSDGHIVGVNPSRANGVVGEAVTGGIVEPLQGYPCMQREAPVPDERGRFDFLLHDDDGRRCYVEVKSVTLMTGTDGAGAFPDAVSERAVRHVQALQRRVDAGERAALVFCVQHSGVRYVRPAREIHAEYADALDRAVAGGVEVLAVRCRIDARQIAGVGLLPVRLSAGG